MYKFLLLLTIPLATAIAQKVALITPPNLLPPSAHGITAIRDSLRARNIEIIDHADPTATTGQITLALVKNDSRESIDIVRTTNGSNGKPPQITITGSTPRELMYAALDTAAKIAQAPLANNPLQLIQNLHETPYISERGVSIYTMHRAYFEQRLYDEKYWTRYFDMLASDRFNSFLVIFGYENGGFMAPLYPYFFNTPAFPGVEFVGITAAQQAKNTAAFKAMIRIAHDRGIEVTAGIWDHIYRGGVQGGGIPGASANAGKRIPGLVFGVTTENLSAYTKASLHQFLEVFPEIDAIQFRMHDESGLKHEEMQSFWHDVFTAIKRDHPALKLDLRAKELPDEVIQDSLDIGLKSRVSTKYWMEQMGMPFHPTHINIQNQKERRHGYADLLRYPQHYKIHWQLWSGGTSRLLLWGDPDYVRRFASTLKLYDGDSFEVNEMLATKMLGEPLDETPLEILNPKYKYYEYEFERYWHFYRAFGRLTYNPNAPASVLSSEFNQRFGPAAGPRIMQGLHLASQVLPRIVATSYLYRNFPTTRGWAEMDRQGSLPQYADEDGSDIEQFMNVRDEAKSILANTDTAKRRPEETSRWFADTADGILSEIAQAEKNAKPSNELRSTITDLKILAGLARYHSFRLLAGVSYNLYKQSKDLAAFDDALAAERHAMDSWKQMVDAASDLYSKNLAFGAHAVGFSRHWEEEYTLLSGDFEKLLSDRIAAGGKADSTKAHPVPIKAFPAPPRVVLSATNYVVSARVIAPAGLKSIRLRYRHVTQVEDYQTAEMTRDPKTGVYTATIPESFIDPKWDVMYFVEAIGSNGAGRMYPDLESETPYVILTTRHP